MHEMDELFNRAKETLTDDTFEEFCDSTIRTCGYNSDTFELIDNLKGSINIDKAKGKIERDFKDYSKQNNKDLDDFKLPKTYDELDNNVSGILEKEEIDSILFDNNVDMVDEYIRYNKLNDINIKDNLELYFDKFNSGIEKIEKDPDYIHIKEDIYNDCGLSLVGLENLDLDTSFDLKDFDIESDLNPEQDINLENSF